MTLRATCPTCSAILTFSDEQLGKSICCSSCRQVLIISKDSRTTADSTGSRAGGDRRVEAEGRITTPGVKQTASIEAQPTQENQAGGVSLRALAAAVVIALIVGIALAGGVAFLYLKPADSHAAIGLPSAQQTAAPEGLAGQRQPAPPLLAQGHDLNQGGAAPVPPKHPDPQPVTPAIRPSPLVRSQAANPQHNPLEDREKDPALPSIAGWVMLPDGVTLIVALPDQAKLAYIDTLANKEFKRVALSFKPDRLTVQGKHLCASVQGASALHILDLDTGADKKVVNLPGGTVVDMVCQAEKGEVHVATFDPSTAWQRSIYALNATSGAIALAGDLASPKVQTRIDLAIMGPGRQQYLSSLTRAAAGRLLALDPKTAHILYVAYDAGSGRRPEDRRHWLSLMKYAIAGRVEVNRIPPNWAGIINRPTVDPIRSRTYSNPMLLPLGPFWPVRKVGVEPNATPPLVDVPPGVLRVSHDGNGVAVLGGADQISVFSAENINSRAGTLSCPGASDFVFHPVLDMIAVEGKNGGGGKDEGTALYLFNDTALTQVARITLSSGPSARSQRSGRLLTFGARGTKVVYYDWSRGGYLRSFPLTLTGSDLELLAKAYHAEVRPFRVPGAIEGESMKILASSPDFSLSPQDMKPFVVGEWSGDSQLFARGIKPGAWADLELPAPADGKYHVVIYLTRSWDYGIVEFRMNGNKVGTPIDSYHGDMVDSTGAIDLGEAVLKKGANTLRIEVVASNPSSRPPHYSCGLDCVVLHQAK